MKLAVTITLIVGIAIILLTTVAILSYHHSSTSQAFEPNKWKKARQDSPELNSTPSMLQDLVVKHLSRGMSVVEVTNLIGQPEIKIKSSQYTRVRGGTVEEVVYLYLPGVHKDWVIEGAESLVLHFGTGGQYLREWSPLACSVRRIKSLSRVTNETAALEQLQLGNTKVASTTNQFQTLLGPPDEWRTEYTLNYCLGRRWRFAWDDVFLELHFDSNRRLTQIDHSEH